MPQALQVQAGPALRPGRRRRPRAETYSGPKSPRPVTIAFKQPVAATDGLHTGAYGKTLTFTLSTATP